MKMKLITALMVLGAIGVQADSFIGPGTDWAVDANWASGTAPGASLAGLYVENGATVNYTAAQGTTTETSDVNIGRHSGGTPGDGILNMLGGTILVNNSWGVIVGQLKTGVLTIDGGGSFIQQNDKDFRIGNEAAGNGTVNLIDGTFTVATVNGDFQIGRNNAQGLLDISGGTATFASAPTMGANGTINFSSDSTGSLTITGTDQTYYEGLYTAGDLTRGGTQIGTFASDFSVTGSTLTAIPEPATLSMVAAFGGAVLFIRRKLMI